MSREQLNRMEAGVSKPQLPGGLNNHSNVPLNIHPPNTQAPVLDNHNWKPPNPMENQDAQDTVNHIQQMLNQLNSRGVQSILVTVGPFGDIGLHGSQKGQLFLKENSDIGDRFAKMCTELIEVTGVDRQEHVEDDSYESIEPSGISDSSQTLTEDHKSDITNFVKKRTADSVKNVGAGGKHGKSPVVKAISIRVLRSRKIVDEPISKVNVHPDNEASENEPFDNAVIEEESSNLIEEINNEKRVDGFDQPMTKKSKFKFDANFSEDNVKPIKLLFHCERCKQPFENTASHNRHVRSKSCYIKEKYDFAEDGLICPKCYCFFNRQDYLDVHDLVHEETDPNNFEVEFVDLSDTIQEIERIPDDGQFFCDLCVNTFPSRRLLLHHTILTHGKHFVCKTCETKFYTKANCKGHMRTHTHTAKDSSEGTLYHCQPCMKVFQSQAILNRHNSTTHTENDQELKTQAEAFKVRSYPCAKCKKIFSSQAFLDTHKETEHLNTYQCTHKGCKQLFMTQENLEAHMLKHEKKSFMCSVCGKIFKIKANFQTHMSTHNTERNFQCDVCNKQFKTKDVLCKHKRIHSNTRPFCCDICGWGFNQSGTLKKHMDSHNKIKRYECDFCAKKFTNKSTLQNHKLQNNHLSAEEQASDDFTNSKKCEYCDKLFPPGSMYMYRRHVVIHTGVKPYSCEICSKSFSDKTNLKYHRLIHSDNKPYSCSTCGKGFVQKRGLKKHLESSSQSCNASSASASGGSTHSGNALENTIENAASVAGVTLYPSHGELQNVTDADGQSLNMLGVTSMPTISIGQHITIPYQVTPNPDGHYDAPGDPKPEFTAIPKHLVTMTNDMNSDGQTWVAMQ